MKKLMVLALAAMVLGLMASAVAAQCVPSDFTIQAEVVGTCTPASGGTAYKVKITATNGTGAALSNVKVQGGTSAWTTFVPWSDDVNTCESSLGWLTPGPMNPKKPSKNTNKILTYNQASLADAGTIERFVVVKPNRNGFNPDDCTACGEGPNLVGSYSAVGYDGDGNPVVAQALDQCGEALWLDDVACIPNTHTPPVFFCDFYKTCCP